MDRMTTPRLADPAIIATVGLEPDQQADMYPHKQSACKKSFELFGNIGGIRVVRMVKTSFGPLAEAKFIGEDASLKAINDAVEGFAPKSFGYGRMERDENEFFIVTELLHVELDGRPPTTLGQKLATMHSQPAPIIPGFGKPAFGFPITTFCGDIAQDNTWKASWPQFLVENRLRPICQLISTPDMPDSELEQQLEKVIKDVVPALFGRMDHGSIVPSLLHGNLL